MKPSLVLPAAFALLLSACQTSEPEAVPPADGPLTFVGRSQGDSLRKASDLFGLDSARIEGDSLYLWINHGAGCAEHDFKLYAGDYVLESHPVQVDVWLDHDGHGETCMALFMGRIGFDVRPLRSRVGSYMDLRVHPHPASGQGPAKVPYRWPVP